MELKNGNILAFPRRALAAASMSWLLAMAFTGTALAQTADTPINLDPEFGIPAPPANFLYNPTNAAFAGLVLLALAMIAVVFAIRDAVRYKAVLPVMVALAGAAVVIPEVYVDVLGAIYWPWVPDQVAFTILGRPMTWFTVAVWFSFGSIAGYGSYALLLRGVRTKVLWLWLAAASLLNIAFEEIMLNIPGLYFYYGHQPLVLITKMPFWWLGVNVGGLFTAAAILYRYRETFRGWRSLGAFVIVPGVYLGVFGFAAMPATIVINGDYPWFVTQAGGLATTALCLLAVVTAMHLVLQRDPFDMGGVGPRNVRAADE